MCINSFSAYRRSPTERNKDTVNIELLDSRDLRDAQASPAPLDELSELAFSRAQEHTYHGLLLNLLNGMDLEVYAEVANNFGRLDLLIQMPKTSYVIELKLDSSPEAGLKQIISKGYDRPYRGQGKSIVRVGLSFSSDKRNIDTWQGELLDEHGALIRKLAPEAQQ